MPLTFTPTSLRTRLPARPLASPRQGQIRRAHTIHHKARRQGLLDERSMPEVSGEYGAELRAEQHRLRLGVRASPLNRRGAHLLSPLAVVARFVYY